MSEPKTLTPKELDVIAKSPRGSWGPLLLGHITALEDGLAKSQKRVAELRADRDAWEATAKLGVGSKSPCGHLARYAWTEDGGKNILCLLCVQQERDRLRKALERIRDFKSASGEQYKATEIYGIAKQATDAKEKP